MLQLIPLLLPTLGKVLDKLIPDVAEREKVKMELQLKLAEQEGELLKALIQSDVAQAEINKIEAASTDRFKSYPRPLAMWVCVGGLVWEVFMPVITQLFVWTGHAAPQMIHLPEFVTGTFLTGLLGLAGVRSYEKKQGLTK